MFFRIQFNHILQAYCIVNPCPHSMWKMLSTMHILLSSSLNCFPFLIQMVIKNPFPPCCGKGLRRVSFLRKAVFTCFCGSHKVHWSYCETQFYSLKKDKRKPPQTVQAFSRQKQKASIFLLKSRPLFWQLCSNPLLLCYRKNLHKMWRFSLGRGRRIRTLNKGFGDPRVTITPCPYVPTNKVNYTA